MISHAFVFEVFWSILKYYSEVFWSIWRSWMSLWLSHIESFTRHRTEDHRIHRGEGRDLRLSIPLETLLFQIDFMYFTSTFGWFHARKHLGRSYAFISFISSLHVIFVVFQGLRELVRTAPDPIPSSDQITIARYCRRSFRATAFPLVRFAPATQRPEWATKLLQVSFAELTVASSIFEAEGVHLYLNIFEILNQNKPEQTRTKDNEPVTVWISHAGIASSGGVALPACGDDMRQTERVAVGTLRLSVSKAYHQVPKHHAGITWHSLVV